jgi:valyl-tRNA synthetase
LVDALDPDLLALRGVLASGLELAIPLAGLLDLDAEQARLSKELAKLEVDLAGRTRRLADDGFLSRAPASVVEKERRIERELLERKERLVENLRRIQPGSAG